jgi:hypothetical protein
MFRLLAFFIACLSGAALVSAQTAANYTNTSGSSVRTASPEAKAEAKRLYKEGVKYGLAGLFQQAVDADAHYALGHATLTLSSGGMRLRV